MHLHETTQELELRVQRKVGKSLGKERYEFDVGKPFQVRHTEHDSVITP